VKILLITHSYTPDLTPRAFRWAALAQQFASAGHEVHILCAAAVGTKPNEEVAGIVVHRVGDALLNASARVTPGAPTAGLTRTEGSWRKALRARLRKTARWIWRITYWPDYACGWILPATKKARAACETHRYDWIVSVSHPFSGHVVGWLTHKHAHGARWFVDIGDPFCLMEEPAPNNRRLFAWLNRWAEDRILSLADAISVTTESTQRLYESHFPQTRDKLHLMPPLLSLPTLPADLPRQAREVVRLVFVGTLYRQLRSPVFLLQTFAALAAAMPHSTLELHFYGAVNDCGNELAAAPDSVRSRVFVHGVVDRAAVHAAMLDADILVNIGNESASQLASKVIEYMSVGRPILNIIGSPADTSLTALSDYPATLTLVRSIAPTGTDLASLRTFIESLPQVHPDTVARVRDRYSAAHIAGLYRAALEQPHVGKEHGR